MRSEIVIGSRGSALALWQSRAVAAALEAAHPGLSCRIEVIKTTGDVMREASLTAIAGKGVFTKEIEDAMLERRVDLAVHSLKDLPTTLPEGLELAAITEREDPRDALVARPGLGALAELPERARVGTSSPRRRSQLLAWRPDLELVELRGNVDTRIRKIETEGLDAIVLACAGLRRLGLEDRITEAIPVDVMVPAVGQGALGLETRAGDEEVLGIAGALVHEATARCCAAERAFLAGLGGGCAVPIAGHATIADGVMRIVGTVGDESGRTVAGRTLSGPPEEAEALGRALAESFGHQSRSR
jgi:hydroxymethylbilane synthase